MKKQLSGGAITGIGIGVVVLILAMTGIGTYNSLAKANQNVDAKWSQVENVLQRRYDLIPNLVNAVKGSMKQERAVFGDIAAARSNYAKAETPKEKANANSQLDQSVGTLINVIKEAYPELNSNKQVDTLMTQLEGSENRIAVERKRYNDAVLSYNNAVVTFPKNIFANMMGMGKKEFFKADQAAQSTPKVDLDVDDK